jgi:predicted dehydrogenase
MGEKGAMMSHVRFGIVGLGGMGRGHAQYLAAGQINGAILTAVSDTSEAAQQWAQQELGPKVVFFDSYTAMLQSGLIDAVIVATPHYFHPDLAVQAFHHQLHVLIEKPAGVYTQQVRQMNEVALNSGKVFGIMYNQRTNPVFQKVRDLIATGELGNIKRFNWIITDWYRSQAYYNSGSWRATWAQEGGGILMNQSPHNIDLMLWTLGMQPSRVRAFCHFGKHRNIEVEDDVTAYMECANGATGVYITTTGDAPGTNRYEVSGERGKIVVENNQITFWRLRVPEPEFNQTNTNMWASPETWKIDIPVSGGSGPQHPGITQNFTDAIRSGTPLLAPGIEGIHGLTLVNAMYLSTWTDDWVNIPFDENVFLAHLNQRRAIQQNKDA